MERERHPVYRFGYRLTQWTLTIAIVGGVVGGWAYLISQVTP